MDPHVDPRYYPAVMSSFIEKLDAEALEYFNTVASSPFSEQCVAFLNAYWSEVGSQAEYIFAAAWELCKEADMEAKGISLVHKYSEGFDMDFDIGLRFYELLTNHWENPKNSKFHEYEISNPGEIMTSIARKRELREKVDVNFDGRISMLEYLLYQYKDFANPADFVTRSMSQGEEHPEITKARLALEAVNKKIKEYECEKARLQEIVDTKTGVRALAAKNTLEQIDSSPMKEQLNRALITAEAAVRIATKKFGGGASSQTSGSGERAAGPSQGAIWWMNRDLEEKKRKYGRVQGGRPKN